MTRGVGILVVPSASCDVQHRRCLTSTEPGRVFDLTTLDFGMQGWHVLIVEGHFTAHKHIKHYAKTPNVDFWPGVILCIEKLGRCEIQ